MTKQNWGFNTRQIHAGYRPDKETGSPVPPFIKPTVMFLKTRNRVPIALP